MSLMGYDENDIYEMMACINTAYEIIDGPAEVEAGLQKAVDFLDGMLMEGRI